MDSFYDFYDYSLVFIDLRNINGNKLNKNEIISIIQKIRETNDVIDVFIFDAKCYG